MFFLYVTVCSREDSCLGLCTLAVAIYLLAFLDRAHYPYWTHRIYFDTDCFYKELNMEKLTIYSHLERSF